MSRCDGTTEERLMEIINVAGVLALSVLAATVPDEARKKPKGDDCPLHAQHAARTPDGSREHGADVDARHDTFGMSHQSTRHSFRMFVDGGAIELYANDSNDVETVDAIRDHLKKIAEAFTRGDFTTPRFVHGYEPNGVDGMKRAGGTIAYRYEERPGGGRIRIDTRDRAALGAVHEFIRFQVIEHRTKDSGKVEEDSE